MKCVRKNNPCIVSENGTEFAYSIVPNKFLDEPLSSLPEFDPLIVAPLNITDGQYTYLSSRSRTFWLVSWLPELVLQYSCLNCGADNFCYIYHDSDVNPDGSSKKTHAHILLNFSEPFFARQVAFWFRTTEIKTISYTDISKEFNYLTHSSENCRKQGKWQYSPDLIVSNGLDYWRGRCVSIDGSTEPVSMFDDFVNGMKVRDMVVKYGFKFFTYFRSLKDMSSLFSLELLSDEQIKPRNQCSFVQGHQIVTNNSELAKIADIEVAQNE